MVQKSKGWYSKAIYNVLKAHPEGLRAFEVNEKVSEIIDVNGKHWKKVIWNTMARNKDFIKKDNKWYMQ